MNPRPAAEHFTLLFFLFFSCYFLYFLSSGLQRKKYVVDGCSLLKVYVNVPLGVFQFDYCQMESVFSAAARNH